MSGSRTPFEHTGAEWPAIGWIRNAFLGLLVTAGAILLFPFTLLVMFLRGLWYLANSRVLSH